MFARFLKEENGATAIEYGLIAALISVAIIGGFGQAANALGYLWGNNQGDIQRGLGGNY